VEKNKLPFMLVLPVFLALFSFGTLYAQCFEGNSAFGDGEVISYQISYNWGPIWVNCGKVKFEAAKAPYKEKTAWHLKVAGQTYPSYDGLFKVRDYYDAWVNPATLRPLESHRYVFEGKYSLQNTMLYLPDGTVISNTIRGRKPLKIDTLKPGPCAFDMLSSVYFVRTLNLASMPLHVRHPVTVLIDDSVFTVYFRKLGTETIRNTDGNYYRCMKIAVKMVEGTVFKGNEDVMVWLTDDQNKIPIYIEAKILIGSVRAYLKETRNLMRPLTVIRPR